MSRLPESRNLKLVSCLLLLALVVPFASIADDCSAEANARLEHTNRDGDVTHLQFKVDVSTQADCGKILWDLVIEEQLPNGQTKKIRKPFVITLHSGSVQSSVRHEMPGSHSMVSYEAKIVSCGPCEDV
jgi:hypothetical protein